MREDREEGGLYPKGWALRWGRIKSAPWLHEYYLLLNTPRRTFFIASGVYNKRNRRFRMHYDGARWSAHT